MFEEFDAVRKTVKVKCTSKSVQLLGFTTKPTFDCFFGLAFPPKKTSIGQRLPKRYSTAVPD